MFHFGRSKLRYCYLAISCLLLVVAVCSSSAGGPLLYSTISEIIIGGRPPQKLRIWAVDIHRAQEKNTLKIVRNRSQAFPVGPTTKSTSANIRKI